MSNTTNELVIPLRIAIIMDGNGRWATQRGMPRIEGHKEGEKAVAATVLAGAELGLEALTLYAFSTENWKRPVDEVRFLMNFNRELLDRRVAEFHSKNIKIRFIGRRGGRVPRSLARKMDSSEKLTRKNTGMKLNIAFNYGGRAELVDAMRLIGEEIAAGKMKPGAITERTVAARLYAPDITDYDLMIRTAGEMRISNFLLWQIAYAELYVTPVTWPEFRKEHLLEAIAEFNRRTRRFGA
ncbi:MAG: di-trans,poly-cis-decaprenylcistransferase [Candidatus Anoxymicrobium japonicum]|uniref:Isoprenyl transferase n=1 Tax=Candidatus Anoxymicrobium japonicum TaxID=2013648 RepID=A0A2N3G7K7_9ACTN|nr:MAG: di-trans,poly-cis-decaprenylcistransferase [Candidatus Anoxymicrobium japonicum]